MILMADVDPVEPSGFDDFVASASRSFWNLLLMTWRVVTKQFVEAYWLQDNQKINTRNRSSGNIYNLTTKNINNTINTKLIKPKNTHKTKSRLLSTQSILVKVQHQCTIFTLQDGRPGVDFWCCSFSPFRRPLFLGGCWKNMWTIWCVN